MFAMENHIEDVPSNVYLYCSTRFWIVNLDPTLDKPPIRSVNWNMQESNRSNAGSPKAKHRGLPRIFSLIIQHINYAVSGCNYTLKLHCPTWCSIGNNLHELPCFVALTSYAAANSAGRSCRPISSVLTFNISSSSLFESLHSHSTFTLQTH